MEPDIRYYQTVYTPKSKSMLCKDYDCSKSHNFIATRVYNAQCTVVACCDAITGAQNAENFTAIKITLRYMMMTMLQETDCKKLHHLLNKATAGMLKSGVKYNCIVSRALLPYMLN